MGNRGPGEAPGFVQISERNGPHALDGKLCPREMKNTGNFGIKEMAVGKSFQFLNE